MNNHVITPLSAARWIWAPEESAEETNVTFEFEGRLHWLGDERVGVAITADSRYRLLINDKWIMDGPARGYPDYGFYDEKEITDHLRFGENHITLIVVHFGVDTFQYQRGEPGVQAAFYNLESQAMRLVTDEKWKVRRAVEWMQRVPRISCQQEFEEHFDARIAKDGWRDACVREQAERSLRRRETGTLSCHAQDLGPAIQTEVIHGIHKGWSIPLRKHLPPFPRSGNLHGMAGVLASQLNCAHKTQIRLCLLGSVAYVYLDGERIELQMEQDLRQAEFDITAGPHLLSIGICTEYDHSTELAIGYESTDPVDWRSPILCGATEWASTGPLWSSASDTNCFLDKRGPSVGKSREFLPPFGGDFSRQKESLYRQVSELAQSPDLKRFSGLRTEDFSQADMYLHLRTDRLVQAIGEESPLSGSDVRQLFDLGEMTIGYIVMEVEAPAGTVIDGYLFEHRQGQTIQYMNQHDGISYRNCFRYIARGGRQTFLSRKRRGFRYAQLTVRHHSAQILRLEVIESTYSPQQTASFTCSDDQLNRNYAVSQRTLLLCMEDSFTDCPTYEQTFWVGDARNEALFAQYAFGAFDLSRHSLRLAAHSLSQLPLVASQCPSGWDAGQTH
jgi:alpha-L-rhamnosidase